MPAIVDPAPVDEPRDPGPPTRREWWTVLIIVAIGFLLRAALPGRMAVEHFDEGVYASNLYSGDQNPPHAYPDRQLYAPPLIPAVLELAIILGGRDAALWVNVLLGALTMFVVWWGARQCFGPAAGIATALLAATSDYHIAFSRMALTDVPLCLWMGASVFAGRRAVLSGRPLWIVSAAAMSALAWWTKYNGWLTLAVTGSGTAAWVLFDRRRTVSAAQATGRWIAVTALTALMWLPFLWTIPEGSSYADISANHARYFVGLSGWWRGLLWQVGTQRYLDGWSTVAGLALAAAAAVWVNCERFTWNGNLAGRKSSVWLLSTVAGLATLVAAIACGSTTVLSLMAIAGVAVIGVRRVTGTPSAGEPPTPDFSREGARLAAWMVAAWFIGLLLATPLYHPYPRLALPWLMACWLAAGAVAGSFFDRQFVPVRTPAGQGQWKLTATLILLLLVAGPVTAWRGPPFVPPRWTAWQPRTGLREISAAVLRDVTHNVAELGRSGHPRIDAVVYVYGEPGLFFHLEAAGNERIVSSPATSLALRDPVEVAVFLVTGPHAHRMGVDGDPAVQQYRPIAAYPYHPGDLVALDEYPAARLLENGGPPPEEIRLYLVHGPLPSR